MVRALWHPLWLFILGRTIFMASSNPLYSGRRLFIFFTRFGLQQADLRTSTGFAERRRPCRPN